MTATSAVESNTSRNTKYGATDDGQAQASTSASTSTPQPPIEDVRYITQGELTDLRAMQRTYDLAYLRTALSELSFGVLVIKLFDSRFQIIGLVYVLLCAVLAGTALWRTQLALRNKSKVTVLKVAPPERVAVESRRLSVSQEESSPWQDENSPLLIRRARSRPSDSALTERSLQSTTSHHVIVNDTFRTAGDVIIVLIAGTVVLEIVILFFVIDL